MFDDFFTVYSSLEPPPIARETNDTISFDNNSEISDNIIPYNVSENTSPIKWELDQEETSVKESKQTTKPTRKKESVVLKGSKSFEQAFNEALKINPNIAKYKNFLVRTAKRESGFNSHIQNTTGAPYYGYFQMGKNEIALTTKMSVEQFRNNPVAQILGACKLYEMNLKTIKKLGVYEVGKRKGYTDDALVAGAWMGGPGGVKKYLLGLGDPSDSHWYKKAGMKGGSSVGKIMNNWMHNE